MDDELELITVEQLAKWADNAKPTDSHIVSCGTGRQCEVWSLCHATSVSFKNEPLKMVADCLGVDKQAVLAFVIRSFSIVPRVFIAEGKSDCQLIQFRNKSGEVSNKFDIEALVRRKERGKLPVSGKMTVPIVSTDVTPETPCKIYGNVRVIQEEHTDFLVRQVELTLECEKR
jgi:hypothetical protein